MLQVLRRTQIELQDSLIPAHVEKFHHVLDKFERAPSVRNEILELKSVKGFTKAAFTIQWILERVEHSNEDFSTEQLDADASLLNDKFFEAFLSEPYGTAEHTQTKAQHRTEQPTQLPKSPSATVREKKTAPASSPTLTDILDQNLLLAFQRFADIVSKMGDKTPSERKSIFAVLGMIAKSSVESAKQQNKKEVHEFFESVIKFITAVDAAGTTQDGRVAEVMRDVGERLNAALKEKSNGVELLTNINTILKNPDVMSKT